MTSYVKYHSNSYAYDAGTSRTASWLTSGWANTRVSVRWRETTEVLIVTTSRQVDTVLVGMTTPWLNWKLNNSRHGWRFATSRPAMRKRPPRPSGESVAAKLGHGQQQRWGTTTAESLETSKSIIIAAASEQAALWALPVISRGDLVIPVLTREYPGEMACYSTTRAAYVTQGEDNPLTGERTHGPGWPWQVIIAVRVTAYLYVLYPQQFLSLGCSTTRPARYKYWYGYFYL